MYTIVSPHWSHRSAWGVVCIFDYRDLVMEKSNISIECMHTVGNRSVGGEDLTTTTSLKDFVADWV